MLRSIKELEFDFAMKKVAQADFDEMSARLRARAIGLMRQLDDGPDTARDRTRTIERADCGSARLRVPAERQAGSRLTSQA